jgi:MinD-like ATPase involved in chromosome partitioning or flagellar assembly
VDLTRTGVPGAPVPAGPPPAPVRQVDTDGLGGLMTQPPSVTADPAQWGWRGVVRRWTFGVIKPKPGRDEARYRQAEVAVRQHLGGTRLVMVANPKGGSMVSTTTLLLAHTFAALRGGSVAAWDNNESRGTLADRAEVSEPQTSVWHLLGAFERLASPVGTAGDMSHYLRSQPSRAEVLASDNDAARAEQIGSGECGRIAVLMARYFRLTFMDTGNNVRSPNWQWAAAAAHQLVVPITLEPDVAAAAGWMLDVLARRRPDLVAGAVVVIGPSSAPPGAEVRQRMVAYFASRCAVVVEVPFDPQLAGGRPVVYARISETSRRAWVTAAAAVADRLAAVRSTRPDQMQPPPQPAPPQQPQHQQPQRLAPGQPGSGGEFQASVTNLPLRKAQGE